jgi:small subunit ribosomal protein S5
MPEELPEVNLDAWKPKTALGLAVKNKEVTDIDDILGRGQRILETEIVDSLIKIEAEFLLVGQAKGKFGGGQRRMFKSTQKKTMEGNKPKFSTVAAVGDRNGHIGIGLGGSKETVPAREKSVRHAKLSVFKIRRGCGSWQCNCKTPHSIPFAVKGKCGSVIVELLPAPKGKGLCVEKECAKILALAGVKDVWSKSFGQTRDKINMVRACEGALRQLSEMKLSDKDNETLAVLEGGKKKPRDIPTDAPVPFTTPQSE